MLVSVLYSKIHRATVTSVALHYEGSLTIDADLMAASGMHPHQQIDVLNINNGQRFTTYAIPGAAGSGTIQVNGAAAHLANVGDLVIIVAYGQLPVNEVPDWHPTVIHVDGANKPVYTAKASGTLNPPLSPVAV
ncbi:MAG: aspartate 1-decarboxylase [Vampirovibrionales bacterium]|nr:aspartate 1-decarboxylase [Vampirovibrionales bacterium]